jgi:DHA2 family multidrug resistance protein
MFVTAPIAGALSSRMDPRFMMMIGFASFAYGTWIMSGLTTDWDFYELLLPQILRGFGLMICMVPINNVALGTLSPDKIRGASGVFNLTRNLGGAVGLAVINTILTQRQQEHYARLSEHVQWGNPEAVDQLRDMAANYSSHGLDGTTIAIQRMSGLVQQQAMILSFADVFVLLTALFGSLVFCAFVIKKPQSGMGGGGGH